METPQPDAARLTNTGSETSGREAREALPDAARAAVSQRCAPDHPRLPISATNEVDTQALRGVRSFHFGAETATTAVSSGSFLPALMWPYREPERVRTTYPLLLYPHSEGEGPAFTSLAQALDELVPASAKLLRDNLVRLEQIVRGLLDGAAAPLEATTLIEQATLGLVRQLGLHRASDLRLREEISDLLRSLPPASQLLSFSEESEVVLLRHLALQAAQARREAFIGALRQLAGRLRTLIAVEQQKGAGAATAALSMGPSSARFVDSAALAQIVGAHRGTTTMSTPRRERIERALAVFDNYLAKPPPLLILLADDPALPMHSHASAHCEARQVADALRAASKRFDELAEQHTDLFRSLRIAQLELIGADGAYDGDVHEPLLTALNWRAFNDEELLLLPAIVAITQVPPIGGGRQEAISELLVSAKPIALLARISTGPAVQALTARVDLGYLGIGHRQAFIWQSSAVVPEHLASGVRRALQCARPRLLVVPREETDQAAPVLRGQLYLAASVESRDHPLFGYDPDAGRGSARNFDLLHNPALDQPWSTETLDCRAEAGPMQPLQTSFTFADFCLLHPAQAQHFAVIPASCAGSPVLLTLADYLTLDPEQAEGHLPYVWAVRRDDGQLERLVVTRELVLACRDRLGLWQTLQELAGIHNEHVERAVTEVRDQAARQLQQREAELTQQHQQDLERLRHDAAAEALGRLAEALVGLDTRAMARTDSSHTAAALSPPAPVEPEAHEPAGSTEEGGKRASETTPAMTDDAPEEPWIDSALCTSCNDCININSRLFSYNANKQAQIADPSAGTFAELVTAAQKCPARCIHPGAPLNPDEPHLAELVERARKYN